MSDSNMLLDSVDDMNRSVGYVRRGQVLERGDNFRTVHLFLMLDDRLLLQKLPPDHLRSPGLLGSSVAGYVKADETYEQAAHRKCLDELGSTVALKWYDVVQMRDKSSMKFIGLFEGFLPDLPKYDSNQISALEQLSISEIGEMLVEDASQFTETFRVIFNTRFSTKSGQTTA